MKTLMIIILVIVALAVVIYVWATILEKKQEAGIMEKRKSSYRSFVARFDKKYGTCSETIKNPIEFENDILRVYKESGVLVIKGEVLRFADIISNRVELDDAFMAHVAPTVETTEVDKTSLITRSAAGAILGGKTGMLLGGLTAKQKTTTQVMPYNIVDNYCLIIKTTLNQHPIKKFQFYDDQELAKKVSKTINRTIGEYRQVKK